MTLIKLTILPMETENKGEGGRRKKVKKNWVIFCCQTSYNQPTLQGGEEEGHLAEEEGLETIH